MSQIDHKALLDELQRHVNEDKLVKGSYWENGKGCATGCTLHSYAMVSGDLEIRYGDHAIYDRFLGEGGHMIGRLEDCIFEGMINKDARDWPERFLVSALNAVERGATLKFVGWKFMYWLLTDETVNPGVPNPLVRDAIRQCADVLVPLTKGEPVDESAAWSAAWSAESAAWSAAWSAARSAESAAWSAESAAWSAARSAACAARSAACAARSTACAARSAESAARSAESAACTAYKLMSDKLVELMDAA